MALRRPVGHEVTWPLCARAVLSCTRKHLPRRPLEANSKLLSAMHSSSSRAVLDRWGRQGSRVSRTCNSGHRCWEPGEDVAVGARRRRGEVVSAKCAFAVDFAMKHSTYSVKCVLAQEYAAHGAA